MPWQYHWRARAGDGAVVTGTIQADDRYEAQRALEDAGLGQVSLHAGRLTFPMVLHHLAWLYLPFLLPRARGRQLADWFRALHCLLKAGQTLFEAGSTLAKNTSNPALAATARDLARLAKEGLPVAKVFSGRPAVFPSFVHPLFAVGQEAGKLDEACRILANHFDHERAVEVPHRQTVLLPLMVPLAWIVGTGIGGFLRGGVIGCLAATLSKAGWLAGWGFAVWAIGRTLLAFPQVRWWADTMKLAVPWVWLPTRKYGFARWCRSLALLLEAGVPIHQAATVSLRTLGNRVLEQAMREETAALLQGEPLSVVVVRSRLFPPELGRMLATADQTGHYVGPLLRIAGLLESEAKTATVQQQQVLGAVVLLSMYGAFAGGLG